MGFRYCILDMAKFIDTMDKHLIHTVNQRCSRDVPQISMIDQIHLFFIRTASAK